MIDAGFARPGAAARAAADADHKGSALRDVRQNGSRSKPTIINQNAAGLEVRRLASAARLKGLFSSAYNNMPALVLGKPPGDQ